LGEVRDQTGAHRISNQGHDDRDGGRRALDRLRCERRIRNDYIHLGVNQICGKLRHASVIAVGRSPLDHYIPPFAVARFVQTLSKGLRLPPIG